MYPHKRVTISNDTTKMRSYYEFNDINYVFHCPLDRCVPLLVRLLSVDWSAGNVMSWLLMWNCVL